MGTHTDHETDSSSLRESLAKGPQPQASSVLLALTAATGPWTPQRQEGPW